MLFNVYLIFATLIGTSWAAVLCNATQNCPEDLPCCSQYGECGTGSYCLGGCHPIFSYDINSCMPMPVCKDTSTEFTDTSKFISLEDYLGDPDDADWIYSGYVEDYDDASILAMPKDTSGTVLSSSRYVWYGRVGATLKTSRGGGIITAFILFSNAQDEIDWEFVGYNLSAAESNYYYQGVLNWTNMINIPTDNSTFDNYHRYEVDWTEDSLTWYLDGEEVRVLNKEDTYNETTGKYNYPQTPARVQFSLWPAGDSKATGTIEWAGGLVDWDAEDIQEHGYFYMILKDASIQCYDPPSGTSITGSKSYVFNSSSDFDQEYVMITDNNTILGSQDASGLDPDEGKSSSSSSSSKSSSSSSSKSSSSSSKSTSTKSSSSGESTATTTTSTEDGATTTEANDQNDTPTTNEETTTIPTGFVQFSQETSLSTNVAIVLTTGGSLVSLLIGIISFLTFV